MATSGTTVWQYTRDDLIAAALRKLTILGEGESPNASQLSTGQEAANAILSAYQALGMLLWKRVELSIPFIANQAEYDIGIGEAFNTSYPVKLLQAVLSYSGNTQVDMEIISDYDLKLLPAGSTGTPIKVNYHPKNGIGTITVWPKPDSSAVTNNTLIITYQQRFDVFTSGSETLDMPQEWYLPVVYGMADILSDEYGLPLEDRKHIARQSEKYLAMVLGGGTEDASIFFYPDRRE